MRTKLPLFVLLGVLANVPVAFAERCYVFENRSSANVTLNFSYGYSVGPGTITKLDLAPGKRYPVSGQWCWQNGLAADVMASGAQPSWSGSLRIGDDSRSASAGTYSFSNPPSPSVGANISNSYPGNHLYSLKEQTFGTVLCGPGGNGGHAGRWDYVSLKLTCQNGRKWSLACERSGTKCNINTDQFCRGLSQWNVGQHCTEPLNPGLPNGHDK